MGLTLLASMPVTLSGQVAGDPNHEWCDSDYRGNRDQERFCEVREFTLRAGGGVITVDGGPNGGIDVQGWDRSEIHILAKVQAWDRRGGEPEVIVRDIVVETGSVIRADGPRMRGSWNPGWSVSYRLMVPNRSSLDLETVNGGIDITDVYGSIDFRAVNGGIDLVGVGGDVRGRTTNGGIDVDLEGAQWDGAGLDVETTNGGVVLSVPRDFRANLTTGTVNGGLNIDFPITIQGRINRRRITTELNGGGPTIRAVTTNGGVTVRRRG
jgi:hypothetical protein